MEDRENEIIALVTFIHKKIGFCDPPFSLLDFCSCFPGYELMPAELPPGFNGEILKKGRRLLIRYRSGSTPNASRFAIGHEIGHGFLHEDQEFQCKVSSSFSIFKKPSGSPREWEADYFSSELMMPMPLVNRMVGNLEKMSEKERKKEVSSMAELFGVTPATMRTRIEDLERMRCWEEDYL